MPFEADSNAYVGVVSILNRFKHPPLVLSQLVVAGTSKRLLPSCHRSMCAYRPSSYDSSIDLIMYVFFLWSEFAVFRPHVVRRSVRRQFSGTLKTRSLMKVPLGKET